MRPLQFLIFAFLLPSLAAAQPLAGFYFNDLTAEPKNYVEKPALVSERPESGMFYSAQLDPQPPFPYNPFPELDLYSFSGGFIFDDRQVDYVALQEEAKLQEEFNRSFAMLEGGPGVPG